jgi:UDP-N-acetyl-D-galactosamine dehydrogenase
VLGLTFEENCADLRNTRVVDLVRKLESFGAPVDGHDPWADAAEAHRHYGVRLLHLCGRGARRGAPAIQGRWCL